MGAVLYVCSDVAILSWVLRYSSYLLLVFDEYVRRALHVLEFAVDARADMDVRLDMVGTHLVHCGIAVSYGQADFVPRALCKRTLLNACKLGANIGRTYVEAAITEVMFIIRKC